MGLGSDPTEGAYDAPSDPLSAGEGHATSALLTPCRRLCAYGVRSVLKVDQPFNIFLMPALT